MKVEVDGNTLIIRIEMEPPAPSKSGKTLIVASTHGQVTTSATVNGKPIVVGLNAFIYKQ